MATFYGNVRKNNLVGTVQDDIFIMLAGDDIAHGRGGDDVIYGGWGDDSLHGGNDDDRVFGGQGRDLLFGDDGNDDIEGNEDDDLVHGGSGDDNLNGGAGNDQLFGGVGADFMDGGDGIDTASYALSAGGVSAFLSIFTSSRGDAAGDQLTQIENITGSDFADILGGDASANVLRGGLGDDALFGDGGADVLDGGAGSDTVNYVFSPIAVTVSLATGAGSAGDAAGDTLIGIENLIGTPFADLLIGDGAGNFLDGGSGADTMAGGGGNDIYIVDDVGDVIQEDADQGFDTVKVTVNATLGANIEGLVLIEAATAGTGNAEANTLIGNKLANILEGAAGADTIDGRGGADIMSGGEGIDTLSYGSSSAGVLINLGNGQASGGDAEGDTFTGLEDLFGSSFADALFGDGLANTINGGAGADTLFGGVNDDTFAFFIGQADGDTVVDFAGNGAAAGGDQLRFTGYGAGTLVQIDATHWQVSNQAGTLQEIITFSNAALVDPGDVLFV
jgi:Ca2+-binding RTX toxin-like protein